MNHWQRYAAQLYAANHAFDRTRSDRRHRWRSVEPASAYLLHLLVHTRQPKRILEIGTSNGYSAIWLAAAAQQCAARLTTVEIDPERSALAQRHLQAALPQATVEWVVADAADFLSDRHQADDLIFLDAERSAYASY